VEFSVIKRVIKGPSEEAKHKFKFKKGDKLLMAGLELEVVGAAVEMYLIRFINTGKVTVYEPELIETYAKRRHGPKEDQIYEHQADQTGGERVTGSDSDGGSEVDDLVVGIKTE
jgi:hypothetical protein